MTKAKTDIEMVPVRWDRAGNPIGYEVNRSDRGELIEPGTVLPPTLRSDTRTHSVVEGTHVDRAKAFSLRTWQLSLIVGVVLWLLGKLMVGYPLLSVLAMAWLVIGFTAVWAGAFLLDMILSPEGVEMTDTILFWRHVNREQSERHKRGRNE